MAVLGRGVHGGIGRVDFLVGWLGLFPTSLWTYLGRDKGGGAIGEVEATEFGQYARALVLFLIDGLTRYLIAEGNIIVGDLEDHGELAPVLVLDIQGQSVGLISGRRGFGAAHLIRRG